MTEKTAAMRHASDDERGGSTTEAADWLSDYLTKAGGRAKSSGVKRAAKEAGHSDWALRGARKRHRVQTTSEGYPRETWWSLPSREDSREDSPRGDHTTNTTTTTEPVVSSHVGRVGRDGPHANASPLDERARCTGCSRRLGGAELGAGVCLPCRRVRAAEARAAGDPS